MHKFSVSSFLMMSFCGFIGLSQGGELVFPASTQLLHPQHAVTYSQPIAYSVPLAYSAINPAFYSNHQSFVTPSHYSIANFLAQQQQQLLNQYDPNLFTQHHQLSFPSIIGQLPLEGEESSSQSPALPVEPSSTSASPSSDSDPEPVTEPPQNSPPQSPILNRPEGATTVDDDDTVSIESAK